MVLVKALKADVGRKMGILKFGVVGLVKFW